MNHIDCQLQYKCESLYHRKLGNVMPEDGVRLYTGRVEPILLFGAEVAIDIDDHLCKELESVQVNMLRRILGVYKGTAKCFVGSDW